jgi:hypothetical protein
MRLAFTHPLYQRWISRWEHSLAHRDTNRVERPFDWGLDWLNIAPRNGHPARDLDAFVQDAVARSDDFYSYTAPSDFRLTGQTLSFTSPVVSPYPENNTVQAEYFPSPRANGRAVVVIPQWNSDRQGHIGLCKLLNRAGLSAVRLSPAYHHGRMPPELERADYHVSSNLGRTIHATRQSVVDARACFDWLQGRGYTRLGILGTSLGSCIAVLVAAHDARPKAAVFNHVSMHFADVVWSGVSCRHIRRSLDGNISFDELRRSWAVISPASYLDRLQGSALRSLIVWAGYDTTFLPEHSRQVLDEFRRLGLDHATTHLPCGHYTSGRFPFNLWDGFAMVRFLLKRL